MEITTMYQKERKEFGRPVNTFAPSDVFILDEFVPEPELRAAHVERNPTILDVQAMATLSENYVNTDTILHKSQVSVHSQRAFDRPLPQPPAPLARKMHASSASRVARARRQTSSQRPGQMRRAHVSRHMSSTCGCNSSSARHHPPPACMPLT